jgi:hypothetical protein
VKKLLFTLSLLAACSAFAAQEELIDSRFKLQQPDPIMGDWQSASCVAQVMPTGGGQYEANVFKQFDEVDAKPLAVLHGTLAALGGSGWTGAIVSGHLQLKHDGETADLTHITRTPPTMDAKAPAGGVVLFDGTSLDAFANKSGKDWLKEGGPAPWKIVDGLMEVVPGTGGGIITKQRFGDCHVHVEFRTLGAPSNSGVYLETRYEANINETYGKLTGTPNGGFDNCTDSPPRVRCSRPPLEWQTFDIDFTAPRFDSAGQRTAKARATVYVNGVKLYDQQELNPPKGAAGRLGEAPAGPLMLQEHGMPVQFRNVWVMESKP